MTPQDGREEIEAEIAHLEALATLQESALPWLEAGEFDSDVLGEASANATRFRAEAAALRRQIDTMGEKK